MTSKQFLATSEYLVLIQTDRYFYIIWIQYSITLTRDIDIGLNVTMAQRYNLKHEQRIGQLLFYRRIRRIAIRELRQELTRRHYFKKHNKRSKK